MFHVLGAPDLYHFTFDTIHPVGGWDLMETNSNPPQHMGCYMKYKYGHWIASIPQITTPGTYTLNPVTSPTNNCYKIASPNSSTEFFIVEYRSKTSSTYEAGLPGSGLLVYRINPAMTGNLDGPPDEVYIFRLGGTPSQDGTIDNAFFNSTVGRTAINNSSNPYTFLSNGTVGGLVLCNIGAAGTTISFNYGNCGGLQVNPAAWDFGNVNPGSTSSAKSFTVTNAGPGSVTITTLTVSSQFNLSSNTCNSKTLAVSGTCTFSATFSPTTPGLKTGTVTIPSNSPFSPTSVALSGTGNGAVASVSPTTWNFGDQTVSYPSTAKSFTLTNTGAANMLVGTLTVSGDYSLVNNNCSGQTVLPAANCTFGVVFTPTATGTRSGSVSIPSNAFNSPISVTLSGNGTNLPGAFVKSSPVNGASGQTTTVSLTWTASAGVLVYEYCVDNSNDNACNDWFGNGTATTKVLTNLYSNTTYYWQVRSVNAGGIVYANGASTAMWSFSTSPAAPGAFNKSAPANGITGLSTSPNLSWYPSSDATSYEYCLDTTNDNACSNWVSNGSSTTKALSGLSESTTYYWQVRAVNTGGTTYADGSATAFWSFTTLVSAPGAFNKTSPSSGATGLSTSPTLTWGASTGATSYEYCLDTTNDNACSAWTNVALSTSAALSGLSEGTTYYWHVRAHNSAGTTYANGATTAFWAFTTGVTPPAAFGKSAPVDGATGVSASPTLSWAASTGATSYEYCYDTTNNDSCNGWASNGTSTSRTISGLNDGTTYYWHVRALNAGGTTYADGSASAFWSFTVQVTPPAAFNKSSPANGATGQSTSPTLTWGSSTGAASYDTCYDTTNDNACTNWTSNGSATSKALSGLSEGTTYYWHVRAVNAGGTTYANGSATAFHSFTTLVTGPAAFNKSSPASGATGQPTSLTLTWGTSAGAASYEYCYDTTNDSLCSAWTGNGTSTSKLLSGLSEGTTYYWHVRAVNAGGTTYSNGSATAFWPFTTLVTPPGAFNKIHPRQRRHRAAHQPDAHLGNQHGGRQLRVLLRHQQRQQLRRLEQ